MHPPSNEPRKHNPIGTLAGAAFLAVSWTWCIGMFLPILLVRDFGPWAFLVFALPNIVGAAAMGWVLSTREFAARLVTLHRPALEAFSIVTIAFHIYWITWLSSWVATSLHLDRVSLTIVLLLAIAAFALLITRPSRSLVAIALPIWLLSAAVFIALTFHTKSVIPTPTLETLPTGLLWLAPICIFGFALCPYLDLTFHATRLSLTARQSRIAFTLGFGFFFAAMILLTLAYAPFIDERISPRVLPTWIAAAILFHLLIQASFTIAAHRRATTPMLIPEKFAWGFWVLAALAAIIASRLPEHSGLSAGEIGYRLFISFYGLVFPAYVWLVMIPTRIATPAARRKTIRVCAAAVGIAAPMYWMGFIERQEIWLGFGLAVVVLARLFLPRRAALQ